MKRQYRTFLTLTVSLLLILACCAGCAPEQANASLTVWVADPGLAQKRFGYAMRRFKQAHPEVEVQFAEGPEPMDRFAGDAFFEEYVNVTLKEYAEQMRTEVMGRSGPDLILFDENTFPNLYKTVASGVFAPLDPFIEGDETYQCGMFGAKEEYNQAVMDAGVYQGKQYFIPLSYYMPTLMTGKETAEAYHISTDRLITYPELLEAASLAARRDQIGIRGGSVEQILLDHAVSIDYYEKEFSVDRERLEALCNTYYDLYQTPGDREIELYQGLFEGDLFGYIFPIEGSSWLNIAESVYFYGEPYVSPIRNAEGEIAVYLEMGAAINAYSPNQQMAYEFLKYAMQSEGYNASYFLYMGIPANLTAMDKWVTHIQQSARLDDGSYGSVPCRPMPEEYYDRIREWNRRVERVYIDTGLDERVQEWTQPYFRGEQSFDSCYQTMASALEIMISE